MPTLSLFVDLIFYIPVNNCSVVSGRIFLSGTSTKQRIKCLSRERHNTVTPPHQGWNKQRYDHQSNVFISWATLIRQHTALSLGKIRYNFILYHSILFMPREPNFQLHYVAWSTTNWGLDFKVHISIIFIRIPY